MKKLFSKVKEVEERIGLVGLETQAIIGIKDLTNILKIYENKAHKTVEYDILEDRLFDAKFKEDTHSILVLKLQSVFYIVEIFEDDFKIIGCGFNQPDELYNSIHSILEIAQQYKLSIFIQEYENNISEEIIDHLKKKTDYGYFNVKEQDENEPDYSKKTKGETIYELEFFKNATGKRRRSDSEQDISENTEKKHRVVVPKTSSLSLLKRNRDDKDKEEDLTDLFKKANIKGGRTKRNKAPKNKKGVRRHRKTKRVKSRMS